MKQQKQLTQQLVTSRNEPLSKLESLSMYVNDGMCAQNKEIYEKIFTSQIICVLFFRLFILS